MYIISRNFSISLSWDWYMGHFNSKLGFFWRSCFFSKIFDILWLYVQADVLVMKWFQVWGCLLLSENEFPFADGFNSIDFKGTIYLKRILVRFTPKLSTEWKKLGKYPHENWRNSQAHQAALWMHCELDEPESWASSSNAMCLQTLKKLFVKDKRLSLNVNTSFTPVSVVWDIWCCSVLSQLAWPSVDRLPFFDVRHNARNLRWNIWRIVSLSFAEVEKIVAFTKIESSLF